MNKFYLTGCLVLLSGCISQPKATDSFVAKLPKSTSEQIVYENALTSWSRPGSIWGESAHVVEKHQLGHDKTTITVSRFTGTTVYNYQMNPSSSMRPFFIVELSGLDNNQTQVSVKEGGSCITGCYHDFTPEVRKWLNAEK